MEDEVTLLPSIVLIFSRCLPILQKILCVFSLSLPLWVCSLSLCVCSLSLSSLSSSFLSSEYTGRHGTNLHHARTFGAIFALPTRPVPSGDGGGFQNGLFVHRHVVSRGGGWWLRCLVVGVWWLRCWDVL